MSKPLYCPNCGTKLIDEHFYRTPFKSFETENQTGENVVININGWACVCDACNWEGDILPYDEDIKETVPEK